MTPQEEANVLAVIDQLQKESQMYRNYDAGEMNFMNPSGPMNFMNPSTPMNYDAGELNAQIPVQSVQWVKNQLASLNFSSFRVRIIYTPNPLAATHDPVVVQFFGQDFNTGVFNAGGDLVFTNANGDTAAIVGLTRPWIRMSNETLTGPKGIAYARVRPKSITQLENPFGLITDTSLGSGRTNEIVPDDYVDPDQLNFVLSIVPMNYAVHREQGWTWSIDPDQTGTGCSLSLFIGDQLIPQNAIANKPVVKNTGNSIPFTGPYPSTLTRNLIQHSMSQQNAVHTNNLTPHMIQMQQPRLMNPILNRR